MTDRTLLSRRDWSRIHRGLVSSPERDRQLYTSVALVEVLLDLDLGREKMMAAIRQVAEDTERADGVPS